MTGVGPIFAGVLAGVGIGVPIGMILAVTIREGIQ